MTNYFFSLRKYFLMKYFNFDYFLLDFIGNAYLNYMYFYKY